MFTQSEAHCLVKINGFLSRTAGCVMAFLYGRKCRDGADKAADVSQINENARNKAGLPGQRRGPRPQPLLRRTRFSRL